ncbi:WD40 repeat domain-containing protein [Allokutzneria multivorans]|uniref:WD40 repeat domain-containing protein n=1 Tax=Allokutzneria multivorans TaxID=1142134 RepID=A0ABP7S1I0_9PSEU
MSSEDTRAVFAERFAFLCAEAGDPPLKRIAESVSRARRVDERGRPLRVSVQRISDWRRGRNVPAQFAGFATVVEILVGEARKRRPSPRVEGLYDLDSWRSLWESAISGIAAPRAENPVCPYRGLASFRQEDAEWFFGRERSTRDLLDLVNDARESGGGVVMVVGASGAGKSSLLRAGLLPALTCDTAYLAPGVDPLRELDEHGVTANRAGLVHVVDQFEEVFTLTNDSRAQQAFISRLHAISSTAVVVIGVRADFYGQCLEHPELAEASQHRQLALGPMAAKQLREAISGPAKAVGLHLEPGFVELLLRDLVAGGGKHDAGALPLLSHALLSTWKRRQGHRLTIAGYTAAGGIRGSVAATAERAWERLDQAGKVSAKAMLLRLVRIGKDAQDTRRRATRDEVLARAGDDSAAAVEVLEVLAAARLVTVDTASVEITHEALLRAWPRLRQWLDEDREGRLLLQRLDEDAEAWERAGRDPSLLYRGARLAAVRRWAEEELSAAARAFLSRSEQHRRRVVWSRRSAVAAITVFAIVATVSTVVVLRQRDDARYAQLAAEIDRVTETDPSLSARLNLAASKLRPDDENAYTRTISAQNTTFSTALPGHSGAIRSIASSGDGSLLATAGEDGTVRLWNAVSREAWGQPLTGRGDAVLAVALSRDGRVLAASGPGRAIRLWDTRDASHPKPVGAQLEGHLDTINSIALTPDGRTLVSAGETTRIWDLSAPAPVSRELHGHTGIVRAVAVSTDGRLLATAGVDRTARLWDISDPVAAEPLGEPLRGHGGALWSVAFNADSTMLATGSDDKTVRLWDVRRRAQVGQPLSGYASAVLSLAFSADGQRIVTASSDRTVRQWDIRTPTPVERQLRGNAGMAYAVVALPDGNTVVSGGEDTVLRFWTTPPTVLSAHTAAVLAAALRESDHTLVTTGEDRTIRFWDTRDPLHPKPLGRPLTGHGGVVRSAAFVPGGKLLATSGDDGRVLLWDTTDPADAKPFGQPITSPGDTVWRVRFSPDGRTMATVAYGREVRLWDVRDPARPRLTGAAHPGAVWADFMPNGATLITSGPDRTARLWDVADPASPKQIGQPLVGHTATVWTGAVSRDGRWLATSGSDRLIQLWDVRDLAHPVRGPVLTGHTETASGLAFSHDGRRLASSSTDQTVRLWDLASAKQIGRPLTGHRDVVWSVAFSPDGRSLVTTSTDRSVRLWTLDAAQVTDRVCAATSGVLTRELWGEHVPQLPYTDPCAK